MQCNYVKSYRRVAYTSNIGTQLKICSVKFMLRTRQDILRKFDNYSNATPAHSNHNATFALLQSIPVCYNTARKLSIILSPKLHRMLLSCEKLAVP